MDANFRTLSRSPLLSAASLAILDAMELQLAVIDPERIRRRLACEAAASVPSIRVVADWPSSVEIDFESHEDIDLFLVNSTLLTAERRALEDLSGRFPGSYFVLFGTQPDLEALLGAAPLPIHGYLAFNHLAGEEFARSLQVIAFGGSVIEPVTAQMLLDYIAKLSLPSTSEVRPPFDLSDRERQVLDLVRRGLSNKEIALRLRISLGTVRAHLRSIFRKLDVRSRAGAVAISFESAEYRVGVLS
jgi:DNA-binding NarL/FixJ family response regulator